VDLPKDLVTRPGVQSVLRWDDDGSPI